MFPIQPLQSVGTLDCYLFGYSLSALFGYFELTMIQSRVRIPTHGQYARSVPD